MFDFIRKLFGEGIVRLEFDDVDGRHGTAKVPYTGTYDENELLSDMREILLVEHGIKAINLKIVGHIEK